MRNEGLVDFQQACDLHLARFARTSDWAVRAFEFSAAERLRQDSDT